MMMMMMMIPIEPDQDRDDETRARLETCPVTEFSMSDVETLDCFPTDVVSLISCVCIMRIRVS